MHFLNTSMNISITILISISILLITAFPAAAQSSASLFGLNFVELRGQMYENAYAYHLEYKRQWYELLSTDVFVRRFPFSRFEAGAGVTLRVPGVQLFYAQAAIGRPTRGAFPGTADVFATSSPGFSFKPDYSYTLRGGMYMPLGNPESSPVYITFSAGKSWYVDSNYRRVRWTPSSDEIFPGDYKVSIHRERRDYIVLEAGIGIHF